MPHTRRTILAAGTAGLATAAFGGRARAATWETVLDGSFASHSTLQAAWNHRYPWGSDHNGTARMYANSSDPRPGRRTRTGRSATTRARSTPSSRSP